MFLRLPSLSLAGIPAFHGAGPAASLVPASRLCDFIRRDKLQCARHNVRIGKESALSAGGHAGWNWLCGCLSLRIILAVPRTTVHLRHHHCCTVSLATTVLS